MIKNVQARNRVGQAISDLLKVRDDYSGLTSQEKKINETAIRALKDEYFALSNVPPNAGYSEITTALTGAVNELKQIRQDREKFKNQLVTARKILGSINSVLKLIS